jgi:hypothetical protein
MLINRRLKEKLNKYFVLQAMTLTSTTFWDVALYSLVEAYRRFGGGERIRL